MESANDATPHALALAVLACHSFASAFHSHAKFLVIHHRLIDLGLDLLGDHAAVGECAACGVCGVSFFFGGALFVYLVRGAWRAFALVLAGAGLVGFARLFHLRFELRVHLFV